MSKVLLFGVAMVVVGTLSNEAAAQSSAADAAAQAKNVINTERRATVGTNSWDVNYDPSKDTPDSLGSFDRALAASECIARTRTEDVDKALGTAPMSRTEESKLSRAFSKGKGCGKATTTIFSLQRGMLSAGRYVTEYSAKPAFPEHVDAALVKRFRADEREWNADRVPSDRILIDASNCLALSDLSRTDALVRSQHGSKEEQEILQQLFANNSQCAGGAPPPNVSRTFMRSFLSEALYRASVNSDTAPLFKMSAR